MVEVGWWFGKRGRVMGGEVGWSGGRGRVDGGRGRVDGEEVGWMEGW